MPRPLIGVCAAVERADFGVWKDEPAVLLPLSYARAIHGAGGMMAMLPPDRRATEDPAELLDRLDALVLGGGADIDPESQGAEAHPETIGSNPDRDRFEIALAREALERGMPLLGVCRGMQILNVACGGTLDQHLPDRLGHERHRPVPGAWAEHDVRIEPDSLTASGGGHRAAHRQEPSPSGRRHDPGQSQTPAHGRPTTTASRRSSQPTVSFVLGVLWHPEEDPEDSVIRSLVSRATA